MRRAALQTPRSAWVLSAVYSYQSAIVRASYTVVECAKPCATSSAGRGSRLACLCAPSRVCSVACLLRTRTGVNKTAPRCGSQVGIVVILLAVHLERLGKLRRHRGIQGDGRALVGVEGAQLLANPEEANALQSEGRGAGTDARRRQVSCCVGLGGGIRARGLRRRGREAGGDAGGRRAVLRWHARDKGARGEGRRVARAFATCACTRGMPAPPFTALRTSSYSRDIRLRRMRRQHAPSTDRQQRSVDPMAMAAAAPGWSLSRV